MINKGVPINKLAQEGALKELAKRYFKAGFHTACIAAGDEDSAKFWKSHWGDRDKEAFRKNLIECGLVTENCNSSEVKGGG